MAAPSRASREDQILTALMAAAAVLGLLLGIWATRSPRADPTRVRPRHLVDFALTDRTGRTVTRADLTNRLLVVNCLFTSCSLGCRVVNDRMAEIQQLVADTPDVLLLSISVDPRTDTPPVLARFADRLRADTNRWLFLTGKKDELYRLIETSFLDRSATLETLIPGGFSDTDRILLVDPNGRLRHSFNGLKATTPRDVVATLNRIRNAKEHP